MRKRKPTNPVPYESSSSIVSSSTTSSSSEKPSPATNNLNLQAAYLHVLMDLIQSIVVMITGCIIWIKPNWNILDPVLTIAYTAVVVWSSIPIMKSAIGILLNESPQGAINYTRIQNIIECIPNIDDIHNLHVWQISSTEIGLTFHCTSNDAYALQNIHYNITNAFPGIQFDMTIQINRPSLSSSASRKSTSNKRRSSSSGSSCPTCKGKGQYQDLELPA